MNIDIIDKVEIGQKDLKDISLEAFHAKLVAIGPVTNMGRVMLHPERPVGVYSLRTAVLGREIERQKEWDKLFKKHVVSFSAIRFYRH